MIMISSAMFSLDRIYLSIYFISSLHNHFYYMELQGLRVGHRVISSLHNYFLLYGVKMFEGGT